MGWIFFLCMTYVPTKNAKGILNFFYYEAIFLAIPLCTGSQGHSIQVPRTANVRS